MTAGSTFSFIPIASRDSSTPAFAGALPAAFSLRWRLSYRAAEGELHFVSRLRHKPPRRRSSGKDAGVAQG